MLKLEGTSIDWALPRTDTAGRKPTVSVDPHMTIYEALRRRDLTMNAMALDLVTKELIDPFNGQKDMKEKVLRSPDITFFTEDPLRFYRVMQFVGRFAMYPDAVLTEQCKRMDITQVSLDRIESECEKLLLKSKRPSLGLRWLARIERLHEIFPELAHTQDIRQEPRWHPEGTVFEHLMQTLDAAARISMPTDYENLILRYAALCHDLGKVSTTIVVNGRIKSPEHAEVGVTYTRSLLKRMTRKISVIKTVSLLVKYHMLPAQFVQQNAKLSAYRRLALKLARYTNLEMLTYLALADQQGRNADNDLPLETVPRFIETFLKRATRAQVLIKPEQPILRGRDIMDLVDPGPEMGKLLQYAFAWQIDHNIKNKELLKKKVKERLALLKRVNHFDT